MLDWIGSLKVRERTQRRVVLSLSRTTQLAGWILVAIGLYMAYVLWPVSRWLVAFPGALVGLGVLLATLRRSLVFDRDDGVLRVDQRAMWIGNRAVVPLFHLRAVVIVARPGTDAGAPVNLVSPARYVAYVDRRIGDAIYLDESRRCAQLLEMAEAIAEVAELRLEYDAMSQASGDR